MTIYVLTGTSYALSLQGQTHAKYSIRSSWTCDIVEYAKFLGETQTSLRLCMNYYKLFGLNYLINGTVRNLFWPRRAMKKINVP